MKRRLVLLAVLWAALWPLAHRGLVAAWDTNPWKLFGWAMYTVATPPVLVAVFSARPGAEPERIDPGLPPAAQAQLVRFQKHRFALGRAARPDALAQAVFDVRPDVDQLVVIIQRSALDPATGHMRVDRALLPYERGGS